MPKSISFAGGGYMCIYQLGCAEYLLENKELIKDYHSHLAHSFYFLFQNGLINS